MNSKIFNLNLKDVSKGIAVAVLTSVVVYLAEQLQVPGFDFALFDWGTILNVGLSAGLAYLVKNFFSTSEGKLLGMIG